MTLWQDFVQTAQEMVLQCSEGLWLFVQAGTALPPDLFDTTDQVLPVCVYAPFLAIHDACVTIASHYQSDKLMTPTLM